MKLFLIGLPGSGKTSLGKEVARSLHLPFVDLDKEIEHAEKKSIQAIFKDLKEGYFRQAEARVLKEWCQSDKNFVMATGGGAPCFFDNMREILNSGTSIFLDVPAREIVRRMMLSKIEDRPLLSGSGPDGLKDQIEFMRSNRIHFYQQATFTLKGEAITAHQVLQALTNAS